MSAQKEEWMAAAAVAVAAEEADLETEKSTEERADASTAKERDILLETAAKKAEAIAEIVEETLVEEEEETLSRVESEFPSAQIQAGLETTLATKARWTKIEKTE